MAGQLEVKSETGFVDNWQSGKSLAQCNLHMLTSEESCDVSFRVGKDEVRVQAHRYVLISRSCVFHAMLCGPLSEMNEIRIPDLEYLIFKDLLRYLYTNDVDLGNTTVTGLLYAAKKYAVGGLEQLCLSYLKKSLSTKTACLILEQAHLFDEKDLYEKALVIILANGEQCLSSEDFTDLCHHCFDRVISTEDLVAKPEVIFKAAIVWAEAECRRQERETTPGNLRKMLGSTVFEIPFVNMDQTLYVKEVLPKEILTSDETVTIMASQVCKDRDPSPFKRKFFAPKNYDILFYKRSEPNYFFRPTSQIKGRIDFTCSKDVRIYGVYLLGSTGQKYHIRIKKSTESGYLEDRVYEEATTIHMQSCHIIVVKLNRPVFVQKDERHMLYVEINGTISSLDTGDDVVRTVVAGEYSFTKLPLEHNYSNCENIVYGIIVN